MLQQMLDLDRDIVGQAWVLVVQTAHDPGRVLGAVEKVRVAERDVLGARCDLPANVFEHDVRLNDRNWPS